MGPSSNAARTWNFWSAAAITPTCTRSNCSRKNWNANERLPRRGSSRKGLRLAAFAAADDVSAAVQVECGLCCRSDFTGRAAGSGGPLLIWFHRGQVHCSGFQPRASYFGCSPRCRSYFALIACSAASEFRGAVFASPDHAERGPADPLRLAKKNLRAFAAPADEFLRPKPRGAPGNARNDG